MAKSKGTIEFIATSYVDGHAITEKIEKRIENGVQGRLDAQVLKDSNFFCPMDTGTLQKSAIIHSVIGSGRLTWRTPYAREQYYLKPNKSHQKNPNATGKWFEAAKAVKLKDWEALVNEAYKQGN